MGDVCGAAEEGILFVVFTFKWAEVGFSSELLSEHVQLPTASKESKPEQNGKWAELPWCGHLH